jgi:hypothetical protein
MEMLRILRALSSMVRSEQDRAAPRYCNAPPEHAQPKANPVINKLGAVTSVNKLGDRLALLIDTCQEEFAGKQLY